MRSKALLITGFVLAGPLQAQKPSQPPEVIQPGKRPASPPIFVAPPPQTSAGGLYVYEQKPLAGRPYLVPPEQAQSVIDRFRETYENLGSPRVLVYVNRELIDRESGLSLSARSEETERIRSKGAIDKDAKPTTRDDSTIGDAAKEGTGGAGRTNGAGEFERVTGRNTYRVRQPSKPSLADRQTVRDVERLFGRPLRLSGVTLVDQRLATEMIAAERSDAVSPSTEGQQARKDREAIAKIADVVLEILISSKELVVPGISGDRKYTVPDIQATAIRLSDSKIVGQASSADLLDSPAARSAGSFDVREITEATALSLMEDMMIQAPAPGAVPPSN